MGLFKRNKRQKEPERNSDNKEQRSIIQDFYGENFNLYVFRYASSIYSIPEVRTAIETLTNIFSTIPIYHKIVEKDGTTKYLDDNYDFILNVKPNPLQNGSQFWKTVIKQFLLENNVFIEPIFSSHDGSFRSIYPLPLRHFDFQLENNKAFVRFFDKPKGLVVEKFDLNKLIYLSRFSSFTGGDSTNLGLYETVIQALSNQILKITDPKKIKAIVQGKANQTPNLKKEDVKGEMENIKANFDAGYDGLGMLESRFSITPVNWQENDVNRELMAFVINVVYNYFGISETIINNKATEIERETFVCQQIKPIALQLERELTYKLFTDAEIRAGHRIELDTVALSISTLSSKTALFSIASRNGILNIDEMREYLGQPRLPGGLGQMYRVTGDTMNLENVDKFQSAQKGVNDTLGSGEDKFKQKEEDSG